MARRVRLESVGWLYALLLASLGLAFLVPSAALLALPALLRFLAAVLLAFVPIFVANLVFARRFRSVGSSHVAFGANLVGAMVGGVLEYTSLVTGYRALLPVIAALYVLALVLWRRRAAQPA